MALPLAAVVVHHNNFPDVLNTIDSIVADGIDRDNVVVVDNSDSATVAAALGQAIPDGVRLIVVPNHGYGAAANAGIDWVVRNRPQNKAVIVSSHEVVVHPGAIMAMVECLNADPRRAVVGPTLVRSGSPAAIWSRGGVLSRLTLRPRHVLDARSDRDLMWVDGAFCLYRLDALHSQRFDPTYVMYYEETDLHVRLRASGWAVAVAPNAIVEQSTSGAPPYFVGRNAILFTLRHGNPAQSALHVARESLRFAIRGSAHANRIRSLEDFLRGARDARVVRRNARQG